MLVFQALWSRRKGAISRLIIMLLAVGLSTVECWRSTNESERFGRQNENFATTKICKIVSNKMKTKAECHFYANHDTIRINFTREHEFERAPFFFATKNKLSKNAPLAQYDGHWTFARGRERGLACSWHLQPRRTKCANARACRRPPPSPPLTAYYRRLQPPSPLALNRNVNNRKCQSNSDGGLQAAAATAAYPHIHLHALVVGDEH